MIYLLEDDSGIRNFVIYALNNSGFEAEGFEAPSLFYEAMKKQLPELVLLDIMLPEEDGLSILKKLRNNDETKRLPVIMLSAKGTEFDKVIGLDSGADDYIAKPFGTMELISRVKALLRRSGGEQPGDSVVLGDITVYPQRHEVFAAGKNIALTHKEYDLLMMLLKNSGKVFSRDELLQKVWGYDFSGESRTVDVHIRTLRSKLGDSGDAIITVRGVGYKAGEEP
ncbi:MAG: response regulator transcription factor [Ruminococcus sp.]|nr:response regulator transcription factor [Ruminococcus sp.]HRR75689.1 response regulator transcription factor [Ruminococcus sp.]